MPISTVCPQCATPLIDDTCPTLGCRQLDPKTVRALALPNPSNVPASEVLEAVGSLLPYLYGDTRKFDYLTWRYAGIGFAKALKLAEIPNSSLIVRWRREDELFLSLEQSLAGPGRNAVRREISLLLFLRNYALVLKRDYNVLLKALDIGPVDEAGNPIPMTVEEQLYLREARKHYTPQQTEALERLLRVATEGGEQASIYEVIMRVRKTRNGTAVDTAWRYSEEGSSLPS